ncbi:MAG: hypothetical protein GX971_00445 [Firmicutes bacterium]|nr:hypothetical protein [Bacillota bacterium]
MSIRFPDFQVLVSRSEQVPRVAREGDQTGAGGKIAPQVTNEFVDRERKVAKNEEKERIRDKEEHERRRQKGGHDQEQQQGSQRPRSRRRIDLRA